MAKQAFCYGHYNKGHDFIKLAKPPKATTRQNGSSHCVVIMLEGPYRGESQPIPDHELHKGISHALWKWFVKVGLIPVTICLISILLSGLV
jgi:hypothetical protein